MSHTVVTDEATREMRIENRLNAAVRHCRVGKVTLKAYPVRMPTILPPYKFGSPATWPFPQNDGAPTARAWWQNPVVSTCATGHTH